MSKILNRPMFRAGGKVNAQGMGVMTGLEPRMNYAKAGQVKSFADVYAEKQRQQQLLAGIPTVQSAEDAYKKTIENLQSSLDTLVSPEDTFAAEQVAGQLGFLETEEGKKAFIGEKLADIQSKIEKARAGGVDPSLLPTVPTDKKEEPTTKTDTGAGVTTGAGATTTPTTTDSDLKTLYQDLLPLFEKELGPEADEYSRQKYMQLAKFGLGLLAQPGGSLVEAIGKAGEKPLAGLEAVAAREAQARKAPKMLALEAALKQADPSDVIKKVKALSKLSGIPADQVAKSFVTTTAETSADAQVDKFLRESATNLGLSGGAGLNYSKQIKSLYNINPSLAGKFDKLVPQKPVEGEFYVTKSGDLTRFKDNKFLTPSDKGFAD